MRCYPKHGVRQQRESMGSDKPSRGETPPLLPTWSPSHRGAELFSQAPPGLFRCRRGGASSYHSPAAVAIDDSLTESESKFEISNGLHFLDAGFRVSGSGFRG